MFPDNPWKHAGLYFPEETQLLRACLRQADAMCGEHRWVPWPNCNVTFTFGAEKNPMPIGALFMLWDSGAPFRVPCQGCGGLALATSFGGIMSVGTIGATCVDCALGQSKRICGFAEAAQYAVPVLADSEFRIAESVLGAAVTAPRLPMWEVLTALAETDLPSREWAAEELPYGVRWVGPVIHTPIEYPASRGPWGRALRA